MSGDVPSRCDCCGGVPAVDADDCLDLQQMCHVPAKRGREQWWCSSCAALVADDCPGEGCEVCS